MPRNPELFSILGTLLFYLRRGFLAAVLCLLGSAVGAEDIAGIGTAGLPPRSVGELVPSRPISEWIRTHLRMGYLPGSLPMAAEFLKASYNVVTLNVLGKWEIVGPSAHLYPPERVKEAEECMRTHVERCHAAGAKAFFYLGPIQVPSGIRILLAFLLLTPILRSLSRLDLPGSPPGCCAAGEPPQCWYR